MTRDNSTLDHSNPEGFLTAFKKRPHHAWLLTGADTLSKKNFLSAIILDLLGLDLEVGRWSEAAHPSFLYITKEADSTQISIDQIRYIPRFISHKSADQSPKVIVMDQLNHVNRNGENGLLKVLESPTDNTLIFLLHSPGTPILPTILSRCAKINFTHAKHGMVEESISTFVESLSFPPSLELIEDKMAFYNSMKDQIRDYLGNSTESVVHNIVDKLKKDQKLVSVFLRILDYWVKRSIKYAALEEEDSLSPLTHLSLDDALNLDQELSPLIADFEGLGFDNKQAVFIACQKLRMR